MTTENTSPDTNPSPEDKSWSNRLDELLKVKNLEDLRSELSKLASDIQLEIQSFDIQDHLSVEAKSRLKALEQRYNHVIRSIQKVQKQFDREFNKSLRILKRTQQDAENQIQNIKSKITKHRATILKASDQLKNKIKGKSPLKKKRSTSKSKTTKKST